MTKVSNEVATAIQEIHDKAFAEGLSQGMTEGYALGIQAAREQIAALPSELPARIEPDQAVLATPIKQLKLPRRFYNILKTAQINTIGDLMQKTEAELLDLRGFGDHAVHLTRRSLDEFGLVLPGARAIR